MCIRDRVTYQEIQKSPKYRSGFALRFPRYVALREDKSPEEADTLERIAQLYELQERFKAKR
jgi:DNA ligase-1